MDDQNVSRDASGNNGKASVDGSRSEVASGGGAAPETPVAVDAGKNGHASVNGSRLSTIPTAGEMVVAAFADEEGVTSNSFVARDEPPEYGYNRALADARAVETLKEVLEAEGGKFDPSFEPGGDTLASTKKDSS